MRASDLAPTEHDMSNDTAEIKRWTAKRRTALVLEIIRGETTAKEAARQHDLKVSDIQHWHDTFLGAGENGLKSKPKEEMELNLSPFNNYNKWLDLWGSTTEVPRTSASLCLGRSGFPRPSIVK